MLLTSLRTDRTVEENLVLAPNQFLYHTACLLVCGILLGFAECGWAAEAPAPLELQRLLGNVTVAPGRVSLPACGAANLLKPQPVKDAKPQPSAVVHKPRVTPVPQTRSTNATTAASSRPNASKVPLTVGVSKGHDAVEATSTDARQPAVSVSSLIPQPDAILAPRSAQGGPVTVVSPAFVARPLSPAASAEGKVAPATVAKLGTATAKSAVAKPPKAAPSQAAKKPASASKMGPPFQTQRLVPFPKTPPWVTKKPVQPPVPSQLESITATAAPAPEPPKIVQDSPSEESFAYDVLNATALKPLEPDALPLTLQDMLQRALDNSLDVAIAEVQQQRAVHVKREAYGRFLPNLLLSYRQNRFQGAFQDQEGNLIPAAITTYQPGEARVNLPINLGGEALFNLREKEQRLLVQQVATTLARQSTLLNVSLGFFDLLEGYLNVALLRQSLTEAEAQVTLSQARFEEGVGVLIEVLESKGLRNTTLQKELNGLLSIRQTTSNLSRYLGLPADTMLFPQLDSVLALSLYEQTTGLDTLQNQALALSPLREQQQHLVEASELRLRQAIAEAFPTVNLAAYINLTGNRADNFIANRFAGLEVNLNVLEGLGVPRVQRIRQAQQDVAEAKLRLEQTERNVQVSVAQAYWDWQTSLQRVELAKVQLETAQRTRQQALGRYEAGIGNYLEVVTAATSLQEARNRYLNQVLASKRAQLLLANTVGELDDKLLAQVLQRAVPTTPNAAPPEAEEPTTPEVSLVPPSSR